MPGVRLASNEFPAKERVRIDRLWPILRSVADTKNLDLIADNFVDCDVGPRSKHELAGILRQSDSSAVRKCAQPSDVSKNGLSNGAGGSGIVFADVLDYVSEIAICCTRPSDAH